MARLTFREVIRIDPDPLLRLHASLGAQDAATYLREAREELTGLLALIDAARRSGSFSRIAPRCHRVGSLALQLGFPGIRDAAANASAAAEGGDTHATAATVGRLLRLGAHAVDEMVGLHPAVLR